MRISRFAEHLERSRPLLPTLRIGDERAVGVESAECQREQ